MLEKEIKKFKSRPSDAYLVIGADAEHNSDYVELKQDIEEDRLCDIDLITDEDIEALREYLYFGENRDYTVNSRLLSILNSTIGALRYEI